MSSEFVNVFITSKNRASIEKPCNWVVQFPSNLISCNKNQLIRLNVLSFHIPNNFYNINDLNNKYQMIFKDANDNVETTISYYIPSGNYNVLTFMDYLKTTLNGYLTLTYSQSRNTYSYKSTYPDATKRLYLKPINSGQFFGLNDNEELELLTYFEESLYTINMCSFEKIVVNAQGINPNRLSVENLGKNDPEFERSSILLWCSRADVPINSMIKYDNHDGGSSYSYNLYDTTINSFNLVLSDEFGNVLNDALDYTMLLQFEIYEKNTKELYNEVIKITDYLKNIYIYFMIILEYMGLLKK